MLESAHILKTLAEQRQAIQRFGVKKIGLFGSFTSNKQHRESDIDLLVEFHHGKKTFDNYMDLKFFLEALFDRRVDLVVKDALKLELKPFILKIVRYAT
jgi:predicted nucleotidyltransferase